MELDIDRLHDVIEGRLVGRGVGNTTALLVQAVQSAEILSETERASILVIFNNDSHARSAGERAFELASNLGMNCEYFGAKDKLFIRASRDSFESEVIFLSRYRLKNNWNGYRPPIAQVLIDKSIVDRLTKQEQHAIRVIQGT